MYVCICSKFCSFSTSFCLYIFRLSRRRRLHEPQLLEGSSDEDEEEYEDRQMEALDESSEEEELDEDEMEKRRAALKQRAKSRQADVSRK